MEDIMDAKIRQYFLAMYSYQEILVLLSLNEGIDLSYRHLKRHLRRLGLRRRQTCNLDQLQAAIESELQGSGRNLGCRSMSRRLWSRHGLSVGRNTVSEQQRLLDSDGVQARLGHRLSRRQYFNEGPNFLIHIDGYDKIKRYGFAIHGAICGYSRRILWLRVARSNNNPNVVASYFLQYVETIRGVPRCIRMDAGTENVIVTDMQKAFRWFHGDDMCAEKSVIIGSSHTNQRIESWWRQLHQMSMAYWKDMLGNLENQGIFSTSDARHMECVRFCFMQIIQRELDLIRSEWNEHQIRRQSRDGIPFGKPEMLYQHPELFGAVDYKYPIVTDDLEFFKDLCETPTSSGCEEPVQNRFLTLLEESGRQQPELVGDATDLLIWLLSNFH